ncbi:hypothetical protein MJT46_006170 [Ovis ammon polii x Ovis aries]|nr:hypothetical protein MJT46_006170 [Ovis ammon polii x Ovis aries]
MTKRKANTQKLVVKEEKDQESVFTQHCRALSSSWPCPPHPPNQAQKLDFKTSCGFRRRFINPLHSLLMTGGESRFFHRSASHFNSAENNRKVQRNLSGCTSTSPPVNVQLPASNQHMDTHFLKYQQQPSGPVRNFHVDFYSSLSLISHIQQTPKFHTSAIRKHQPESLFSFQIASASHPESSPQINTVEIKKLNVKREEKKELEENISEFEIGKEVLASPKQWKKQQTARKDFLSSSDCIMKPDALSCYYGGVDAKNKAQKSPTTQGCLLLEPEIPLMNETAHHNIHVLSKLLAKRSLKIRQYVVLAKAITLQVYV